jgi:hypothetical protein
MNAVLIVGGGISAMSLAICLIYMIGSFETYPAIRQHVMNPRRAAIASRLEVDNAAMERFR